MFDGFQSSEVSEALTRTRLYQTLSYGHWSLVIGYWLLVIGYWSLVIGYWSLVIGENYKN
jgi:hypothetical protein